MKFRTAKGCGRIVVNAIRQMIYAQRCTLRPIAIKVGTSSNVVSAGDLIVEDMIKITADLSELRYEFDSPRKHENMLIRCDYECHGSLKVSDLQKDNVKVLDSDSLDEELIHSTDGDIFTVSIYFRNAPGVYTHQENRAYLEEQSEEQSVISSYEVLSTRHTDVLSVTSEVEILADHDSVTLNVEVYTSEDGDSVIRGACKAMISLLTNLS